MTFEELSFIERIHFLRMQYQYAIGCMPTRLVLTPSDALEFVLWLQTTDDRSPYISEPYTCEPLLYGMSIRFERYAAETYVFFQES